MATPDPSSKDTTGAVGPGQPPRVSSRVRSAVSESIARLPVLAHLHGPGLPKGHDVRSFVGATQRLVFPGFFEHDDSGAPGEAGWIESLLAEIHERACLIFARSLEYAQSVGLPTPRDPAAGPGVRERAERLVDRFMKELPSLRASLALDVQAAYDGDPAAVNTDETIICYPGVAAVFAYRLAHTLHSMGVPLVPRIITEQAHADTGIDIHPGARIGSSFFIDHGAGVVIGETAVVGNHVKLYQGVTLGARSFEKDAHGRIVRGTKRHPTLGDRVTVYAGAVILGGDTVVGDDCVVSGGVFLTHSVPPGHVVRQKQPELVLRTNREATNAQT